MIKKIAFTTVLTYLYFASFGQSVNPTYLGISPAHFFRNTFLVHLETGYAKDKTIAILPGVILKDNGNEKLKGFQVEVQPRFYLIHPSFEALESENSIVLQPYISPYYGYFTLEREYTSYGYNPNTGQGTTKDFVRNINAHSGGIILGCRLNITNNFYVDVNAGGGFRFANIDDTIYNEDPNIFPVYEDYDIFDFDYTGITPKVGLVLGVRLH